MALSYSNNSACMNGLEQLDGLERSATCLWQNDRRPTVHFAVDFIFGSRRSDSDSDSDSDRLIFLNFDICVKPNENMFRICSIVIIKMIVVS